MAWRKEDSEGNKTKKSGSKRFRMVAGGGEGKAEREGAMATVR